jgi:hypothetical protein
MRLKAWWDKRGSSYKALMQKIVEDRFKGDSKWVFTTLRKTTKYDQY